MLVAFIALVALAIVGLVLSGLFSKDLDDWAEDGEPETLAPEEDRAGFEPVGLKPSFGQTDLIVKKGDAVDDGDEEIDEDGDEAEDISDSGTVIALVKTPNEPDQDNEPDTAESEPAEVESADDITPRRPKVDYLSGGAGDENLFEPEDAQSSDVSPDESEDDDDRNIFGSEDATADAEEDEDEDAGIQAAAIEDEGDAFDDPDDEPYAVEDERLEVIGAHALSPTAFRMYTMQDAGDVEDAIEVPDQVAEETKARSEDLTEVDEVLASAAPVETPEADDADCHIYDSYGADDPVVIEDFDPRAEALNIIAKNACAIGPARSHAKDPVEYSLTEKDGNVEVRVDGGLIAVLKGVCVDDLKVSSYPGDPEVENPNLSLCYAAADVQETRWPAQAV